MSNHYEQELKSISETQITKEILDNIIKLIEERKKIVISLKNNSVSFEVAKMYINFYDTQIEENLDLNLLQDINKEVTFLKA